MHLTVLRPAALDDVHVGKDLHARDKRTGHWCRELHELVERTVGTHAHPQRVVLRFDVNIRCAVADGLLEDQIQDLDHGRVLVDFDDDGVAGIGELFAPLLGALLEVAKGVVDFDVRAVAVVERPLELVLRGDDDADRCLEQLRSAAVRAARSVGSAQATTTRSPCTPSGTDRSSRAASAGRRFAISMSSSWRARSMVRSPSCAASAIAMSRGVRIWVRTRISPRRAASVCLLERARCRAAPR